MMKTYLFSFLFAATCFSTTLQAQVIVSTNVIGVPCCDNSDSIDYNQDGAYDFKIISFPGMDNSNFMVEGIGNVKVASPMNSGQTPTSYSNTGGLTGTTMGCSGWYSYWVPGTGTVKYICFADVVAANDTTFGWAEVHFNGAQNTCTDTMITATVAYSTNSNQHLAAAQTFYVGLETHEAATNLFNVTTSENGISLTNEATTPLTVTVFNAMGQLVTEVTALAGGQSKTVSKTILPDGVYFLTGTTSGSNQTKKIYVR